MKPCDALSGLYVPRPTHTPSHTTHPPTPIPSSPVTQLGYAYHMVGRTAEARKILATVRGRVRKNFTFDQYAARKAGEYVRLAFV